MKIGIDANPFISADKFRGVGSYTETLISGLKLYDLENIYRVIRWSEGKERDFDAFIFPYFSPFNISLPFLKTTKVIVTVHDLIPLVFSENFPIGLKGRFSWFVQKNLLKGVNGIITDSFVSKKDIQDICSIRKSKIFVVYPAINEIFKKNRDFRAQKRIRQKYQLPDDFILYVGDSNWNKNVPSLIKASKVLKLPLVLVGEVFKKRNVDLNHPWNKSLKEVKSLIAGDNRVLTLGFIPSDDLVNIYNLALLYVQPSYYEGFGLPVVEAMASGCPVISSSKGSLPEIGGDASLYFDPYKDELPGVIKKLSRNKVLREKLISKGSLQANKFSSKNMVQDLKHVFSEILN